MKDPVLRGGLLVLGLGIAVIAVVWRFFLRPSTIPQEPLPSIPITDAAADAVIFEIDPTESGVRFTLNETLRGQPKTVVGVTKRVAGQIALDWADLTAVQVGVIQVDARAFYTDDLFRDESLHAWILDSQDYPLITFSPTGISDLPAQIEVGETAVFRINGDLTIRDTTRPVTFTVTAVPITTTRLEGRVSATINRSDFALNIPQAPGVANVDEIVLLEIEFVATAVSNRPK